MTARVIDVQGLVRQFKKGPRAVDGINLYVDQGEIYGFLGPNGAGKSTTVKMLTTLLPPSGGQAVVGGYDIASQGPEVRKIIGVALQDAALDPLLTAREHFRLQGGLQGLSRAEAEARGEELLARVALTAAADRKSGTFSGGMRRRLDLALSLVHRPSIVFLDEPTTGLDPQSRTSLWEEVRRLAKDEGVTIFLTTQYLEEADQLADRIGIIDTGIIVAEGTPDSLKAEIGRPTIEVQPENDADRPRIEQVLAHFGEPVGGYPGSVAVRLREAAGALADVVRALDAAAVRIANLKLHAPTLDDVFLAKTGRSLEGEGEGGGDEGAAAGQPQLNLEVAVGGRSRIERVPTAYLKDWMAERHAHQAAQGGPPTLVVQQGPLAGHSFRVDSRIVIGRQGVDMVFDDAEISRRHASLQLVQGSLVIEDLRSLNGTWVNGTRITAPTLLRPGDYVQFGKTLIEVRPGS
jgi:ABC-2 type transport system ATP-binding protein